MKSKSLVSKIKLSDYDKALLSGAEGKVKQMAMKIIFRIAEVQGATEFIDVSRAHIDGCIYLGESSLLFASKFTEEKAKVCIPTTMNAISIDRKRWKDYGIPNEFAEPAGQLAKEYEKMGVLPTFSCTPYQLPGAPEFGEHIAWAESNAVVFANSVIGARTNRYGDFMDICAALTGRVPLAGYHKDEERLGTMLIRLPELGLMDSSFYPLLGYMIGSKVGNGVPVIEGLQQQPTMDDLKSFGAAIATSGSVGMFHIVGVTPEAATVEEAFGNRPPSSVWEITEDEIEEMRVKLAIAHDKKVDLVLLGSPQISVKECQKLSELVVGKACHPSVKVIITTNDYVYEQGKRNGSVDAIEKFGASFLTDTCLCMISPFIQEHVRKDSCTIMTNSGKFTHYGPGLVGGGEVHLASFEDCIQSAINGTSHNPNVLGS